MADMKNITITEEEIVALLQKEIGLTEEEAKATLESFIDAISNKSDGECTELFEDIKKSRKKKK